MPPEDAPDTLDVTFNTLPGITDGTGHRERLRQRILTAGAEGLLDHELLEYLLALAIPRGDTKPKAKALIARFGSLAAVLSADPARLKAADLGNGPAAAIKFVHAAAVRLARAAVLNQPILSGWAALLSYCHAAMAHNINEEVRVLFLNNKNRLMHDEVMGEGTVNHAPVYIREIARRALDLGATAIILVHNHPSGDPTPSREDIVLTRQIIEALKPLSIVVHDHVVIGRTGHASFKELGLLR